MRMIMARTKPSTIEVHYGPDPYDMYRAWELQFLENIRIMFSFTKKAITAAIDYDKDLTKRERQKLKYMVEDTDDMLLKLEEMHDFKMERYRENPLSKEDKDIWDALKRSYLYLCNAHDQMDHALSEFDELDEKYENAFRSYMPKSILSMMNHIAGKIHEDLKDDIETMREME